jgi:hypothetical protein
MPGKRIDPAFQSAFAIPLMAFRNGALADGLYQIVGDRSVARQRHRKTPQSWQKAHQVASDIDGRYRLRH